MKHTLEAGSIIFTVGGRSVLSSVYLTCRTGNIVGLLGRNGSGKTSLMNIIFGKIRLNDRCIRVDETVINQGFKVPGLMLFLPQQHFIPGRISLKRVFSDFELDFRQFRDRFPDLEIDPGTRMSELSGGGRRLVEIYVVLSANSKFALLDEPFSQLSPVLVDRVKELLQEAKGRKGIILTDHMYQDVVSISDTVYLLTEGRTVMVKDREDLQRYGYVPWSAT